jgi:serine/threonine protein kinase
LETVAVPPKRFGRYEIVRTLGHGGMAEVFEARHVDLGTRVAIKVIHPHTAADADAIRHVLNEGRTAAAVRHPHVVAMLDVGMAETPYLVMELLEGEDLSKRLARERPLSLPSALDLLLPVASGVAAAHGAGVVHRDLKPSNVFLAQRRGVIEPVVVDFGISKALHSRLDSTKSSRPVGTPHYMAPEVLRRAGAASPASDQYSLGIVLYECVTGGTPFWNDDYYELLHAIMTAGIVAPSELNPVLPAAFDAVILRALARDPANRFPSIRAFASGLVPFACSAARQRWSAELDTGERPSGELAVSAPSRPRPSRGAMSASWPALVLIGVSAVAVRALATSANKTPHEAIPEGAAVAPATARSRAIPAIHRDDAAFDEKANGKIALAPIPVDSRAPPPKGATSRAEPLLAAPKHRASESSSPALPKLAPEVPAPSTTPRPLERGTGNIPIVE